MNGNHEEGDSTSGTVTTKQARIAYRARTHPQEAFVSLSHNLTGEWLGEAYLLPAELAS